jgi:hypothetical protein
MLWVDPFPDGCFRAIAPLALRQRTVAIMLHHGVTALHAPLCPDVPERSGRLMRSATPCYPNRRAFSRSRSSRISLSSASVSNSASSIGSTSSPLRTMGFTKRGFLASRLSRMSVTLPSGSLSASKLACEGNKSRQAILPLLSAVNVLVELSYRGRTVSSPFGRELRRQLFASGALQLGYPVPGSRPFCGRRTSGWRTSFDCFERAAQRENFELPDTFQDAPPPQ